jgi:hypothetical protein
MPQKNLQNSIFCGNQQSFCWKCHNNPQNSISANQQQKSFGDATTTKKSSKSLILGPILRDLRVSFGVTKEKSSSTFCLFFWERQNRIEI